MHPQSRRTILKSIATAGSLPLAGCQTPSTTTAQFDTVTTEGTTLIVTLDSSDGVDQLTVIGPDGGAFETVDATAGQTKYTIDIGTAYTPGEYELNTVADDDVKATTSINLRPELSIAEVGVGANHMEQMPEGITFPKTQVMVLVRNTGNGPETITNLEVRGDVPNPTYRENQDESGIFDEKNGYGELESLVIGGGEEVRFFSSTQPFARRSESCEDGVVRINLLTIVSEEDISKAYQVDYRVENQDDCQVNLLEGD